MARRSGAQKGRWIGKRLVAKSRRNVNKKIAGTSQRGAARARNENRFFGKAKTRKRRTPPRDSKGRFRRVRRRRKR